MGGFFCRRNLALDLITERVSFCDKSNLPQKFIYLNFYTENMIISLCSSRIELTERQLRATDVSV